MSAISIQHGEGDGRAGDKSRQMNWTLLAFNLAVMMSRGEKGRSCQGHGSPAVAVWQTGAVIAWRRRVRMILSLASTPHTHMYAT